MGYVVVLAGTVAADPVTRRMPLGDEVPHVSSSRRAIRWPSSTVGADGRAVRMADRV